MFVLFILLNPFKIDRKRPLEMGESFEIDLKLLLIKTFPQFLFCSISHSTVSAVTVLIVLVTEELP